MANVRPKPNLPEPSQPWGRSIEEDITQLGTNLERSTRDNGNTLQQLNASIGLLTEQVATLAAQQAILEAQQATLAAQQATLAEQTAYQASLITVSNDIPTFNSGDVPYLGGGQIVWLTTPTSLSLTVTLPVATGRILITYGCAEMSVTTGSGSAAGIMGIDLLDDDPRFTTRVYVSQSGDWVGSGVARQKTLDVPVGTVTVRARFGAFNGGSAAPAPSVNFREPWMSVQVIPAA